MMTSNLKWKCLITFCLLLCTSWLTATTQSESETDSIQNLNLIDMQGEARTLKEFTGKGDWLVAMVWASYCNVSDENIERYSDFYDKNKNNGIAFIGISIDGVDDQAAAKAFVKKHSISFPSLIGENAIVVQAIHDATGNLEFATPMFLVFAPDGKLVAQQTGAIPPALIKNFIQQQSQNSARL